jgi:hypothetical protein
MLLLFVAAPGGRGSGASNKDASLNPWNFVCSVTLSRAANKPKEKNMPVVLLWGIPVLLVVGGGTYWIMHLH